jgi:ribosomal protein L11 methyltransferase
MIYLELSCSFEELDPWRDIIISDLAEQGFESFEENDKGFKAYCQKGLYNASLTEALLNDLSIQVDFQTKEIEDENWNASWESSFDPILVDDWCLIRAPFHEAKDVDQELVIEPKMSFGTGHHQTTFMMVQWMKQLELKGQHILDMGTGTAVLAVLAEKLGASKIVAIDNEEWAYENALENVGLNDCHSIEVLLGEGEVIPKEKYDVILANINRNALTALFSTFKNQLTESGKLVVSGFLNSDLKYMEDLCASSGFKIVAKKEKETWLSLCIQNI